VVDVALPLTQQELADWTSLSREAVVKALQAFRELGWIETARRRIVVRDLDALRERASGP
jgi:CRP/FNR family cyclic AMP-dependent transcriptional regulator